MLPHNKVPHLALIVFVFVSMTVNCAMCAELYVTPDTTSPAGNGTINSPYNKISSALTAAKPGDTVKLLAGTYFTSVSFPHGGTAGNPITLVSDGPARSAIIDCQNALVNGVVINYGNIVVDGLEVKNVGYSGIKVDGDANGYFDPLQSYGRYAGNSGRYNYANGADNILIQNNYVHGIGNDGLKISHTNNIQLLNNEIYKTGLVHFTSSNTWQQGIDMVGVYNSEIRGNYIHDDVVNPIMAVGVFVKGGSENILIEDNVVENIVSPYAGIEVGGDTEWYNTRYNPADVPGLNDRILTEDYNNNEVDMSGLYAAATTYSGQYMSEARNCIVRGNKIFNADPPLSFRNAYNTKVYNNTIIDSGWSQGWIKLWNDGNKYHRTQNTFVYNNIFLNRAVAVNPLGIYRDKSIGSGYDNWIGFEADYNLIYNMGTSTVMGLGSKVVVDSHSVFADPALDADYRPLAGSVVVDKGVDLVAKGIITGTYTDLYGTVVPQGLYDIGAYEYVTGSPTDPNRPVVTLTAPARNATVSGTLAVTATATVIAPSTVTKVEFYVSGVLKDTETVSPYSYNWNTTTIANGSYSISAKAYDGEGNVGQSSNIVVTVNNFIPDSTLPTVLLSTPVNNAVISGTVSVSATASDNVGVTKVEFLEDNVLRVAMNIAPYKYNLNTATLTEGSHTLIAKAFDAAGNMGQSAVVTVIVNNVITDSTAPSILLFTLPATATTLTVPVTYFAVFDSVGVTGYLITESDSAPAAGATSWTNPAPTSFTFSGAGSKTAYAWAKDAAGNVSLSRSAAVAITIPDTTVPTVSIGVRKNNAAASGVLSVIATANDNVGVSKVEFFVNGVLKSTATVAPYVFGWDSTAGASGAYTLMAKVYDAAGNSGQSGNVRIYVPNVRFH